MVPLQALKELAFPTLAESQIAELGRCAKASLQRYGDGEKLFEVGDSDFHFFVVQSGAIEIRDESDVPPRVVTVHGPGEFTGDIAHLTGQPTLVSAVARGETVVYEISAEALRELLNRCPDLSDIILQAFMARREMIRGPARITGLRVIGSRYSRDTFRIRDFLAKNRVPFTCLDLETDPQVRQLLEQFGVSENDTPVVTWGRKLLLRNPTNRELAEALHISRPLEQTVYDLVIVGAGPAGLAAAVYGASDGLKTVVLERSAPGGQAGTSMRIENYLGLAVGMTGADLIERAVIQANKFGARLSIPTPAMRLSFDSVYPVIELDGGTPVVGKCLLIATGADYNKLGVEGCERFEGSGVYYAATLNEAQLCEGSDVIIVGGGNSAGQAAVFLSGHVRKLYLLLRGDDLRKSMSSYLAQRIEQIENIEVRRHTEVQRVQGTNHLTAVEVRNNETGEAETLHVAALFSFIGATPRTDWLPPEIETDSKGFIVTGSGLTKRDEQGATTFLLSTSRPGVFAAGDVRSGSIKRVASAVGEGAMAVQFVLEYLKTM